MNKDKSSNYKYTWRDFFKLINLAKPKYGLFILSCIISAMSAIVSTFIPNFLKNFIDGFAVSGNVDMRILFGLVTLFILQMVTGLIASYLLSVIGLKIVANVRGLAWTKIVKLPAGFFDKNESGDIASRLVNDTTVLYNLVSISFSQFINAVLMILFCGFWLFYYDWELSLIIIGAIPLFLAFFIPLGKKLSSLSKEQQRSMGRLNISAIEMISENKLIKSFTAENYQIKKGLENIDDLKCIGIKQAKWMATVNPIINLLMMLIIISIVGYGGVKLANGELSPGTFIAFLTLIFYIMGPMVNFGGFFSQLQKTKGATERISNLMYEYEEDLDKGKVLNVTNKDIEIRNLSFKYNNEDNESFTLQNLNLVIKGGHTYAFVGPSGSGKTTLVSLLERFYKPSDGEIYIGGENIEDFSINSWRSQIGYVSQEHSLISGTIRENILFGLDESPRSEEEIINACKMAYAWEFIEDLPNGLDTNVGEKGLMLSGGQRQRIAIARMFFKNPKIILLDEATANLDSKSEQQVQYAMKNIAKDRTAIVIAHRLSTIIDAENIIFMENGKITGQGKHDELQKHHQLYNQFCELQLQAR
ncbi:ABC transporter ATP-binding protein [Bacillus paramobilis]|uniref:ABC transporter ATP-binding protein n=1 Tax=Bacillus paramobilis TaxID=2817477 RepID=A0ABZ2VL37_9BACI